MSWDLASDIVARLDDLRAVMGWSQKELAEDYGALPGQYGVWLAGAQKPAKGRLAAWAKRRGWPRAIFEEGGPMPSTVVNRPAAGSNGGGPNGGRTPRRGTSRRNGDMSETERREALEAARRELDRANSTPSHYEIFKMLEIASGFRKPPEAGDDPPGDPGSP